ncbi:MAG: peptidoglycan -binding protein [Minwuiales bacterium]|nr:peptidoglycan -binding protein [Minwuiales bacterium]
MLSTLLLVIIFLLVVFVLAQFFLSQALSGRDEALERLQRQVTELADLLALEQESSAELRLNMSELSASLQESTDARDELVLQLSQLEQRARDAEQALAAAQEEAAASRQAIDVEKETIKVQLAEIEQLKRDIDSLRQIRAELENDVGKLTAELEGRDETIGQLRDRSKELEAKIAEEQERTLLSQKEVEERDIRLAELQALYLQTEDSLTAQREATGTAQRQVELLNQQLLALRDQLSRLEAALDAAEKKDEENQVVISDLGRRLNLALASKVEELSRYRSEFFGRLRQVLADQRGVRVEGDRFVFQSEVLFGSGSAELETGGRDQLAKLADTLLDISAKIPPELNWIMRVDGHTDKIPIFTAQFPSNWELSSARAISVVKFLVSQGVPADRLVAAGFGEFHPLDDREDEIAFRRNRRIELKLTQR